MQAIADQAGVAVLNARLYTESQRQARVMTALAESAASINTSLRMEEVLQRILNQAMQALQVETAAVALIDAQSGDLVFRAAVTEGRPVVAKFRTGPTPTWPWPEEDELAAVLVAATLSNAVERSAAVSWRMACRRPSRAIPIDWRGSSGRPRFSRR